MNEKCSKPLLNLEADLLTEYKKVKSGDPQDFRKVMQAARDFIFERHRFPQVNDIADATRIQPQRCNEVVDQLIRERELYVAFEGKGLPRIILLFDMMQGVLMTQRKPDWIVDYGFAQKAVISDQIEKLQKEALRYDQFERLLYATDIPLEEAIAYALECLEFEKVIHHKNDSNNPDVTFEYLGMKALLEAEGTTKAGSKEKITQLDGWVQKELSQGTEASKLYGFFAVNHYRDEEPAKRGDPLTSKAKEFLRYYSQFRFFTTIFLFDLVKQVTAGVLTKESARKKMWDGEKVR